MCIAVNNALKNQIIEAIKGPYLMELRDRRFGYLNSSPMDMLDHLFDRYGNLTAIDVQECKNRINEPFNPDEPIAVYFQHLEDEQQISDDGGVPISQAQLLQTALFAFYVSGNFTDACKRWEELALNDTTWPRLKTHFSTEYKSWKTKQRINAQQGGFHSSNAVTSAHATNSLTEALDHLANAAVLDKTTLTKLTNEINSLLLQNKALIEQNKTLIDQNGLLINTIAAVSGAKQYMKPPPKRNYKKQGNQSGKANPSNAGSNQNNKE